MALGPLLSKRTLSYSNVTDFTRLRGVVGLGGGHWLGSGFDPRIGRRQGHPTICAAPAIPKISISRTT